MIDWERFCSEHSIDLVYSGPDIGRGWVGTRCPVCNSVKNKCGINFASGVITCWACKTTDYTEYVMGWLGVTYQAAREELKKFVTDNIYQKQIEHTHGCATSVDLPKYPFTQQEVNYLATRGVTGELIRKHNILSGGVFPDSFFRYRVVLPIFFGNKIVSATGRSIIDDDNIPRYKTLPPSKEVIFHKDILFNANYCKGSSCLLVEGVLDTLLFGDNSLSGFGTSITSKQLLHLSKYKRVFTGMDSDEPGVRAADKISFNLASFCNTEVIDVKWDSMYKDIGDMPEVEREYLRKELGFAR